MLAALKLTNFRGYEGLSLDLAGQLTILVGDNAQGKTNLLRAIEVLGLGNAHELVGGTLVRWGSDGGCVEGRVAQDGPADRLQAGISGRGVRLSLNGKTITRPRWVGRLPVLFLGPEDREQVMGPPSARRALLDELLEQCEPKYLAALREDRRALKQRNRALARGPVATPEEVEIWNEPLARFGGVLLASRVRTLSALSPRAGAWHRELTGERAELTVTYQTGVNCRPKDESAEAWGDALLGTLSLLREREMGWGATLAGPHRDDVTISLNGRPLKGAGSSGEIWSAILALTLASAEHLGQRLGHLPLLLLDDVLSALDVSRRDRLMGVLRGFPQVLLSTTNWASACGAQAVYEVKQHRLIRLTPGETSSPGRQEWDRDLSVRC